MDIGRITTVRVQEIVRNVAAKAVVLLGKSYRFGGQSVSNCGAKRLILHGKSSGFGCKTIVFAIRKANFRTKKA